jgi:hypothetical protein
VKSRFLVIAAVAAGIGCSESKTAPANLSGQMSFTYAGALSGNFNADGRMPLTPTEQRTMPWAAGQLDNQAVFVDAAMPRSATTYDIVFLGITRTTAGSESIDGSTAGISLLLGAQVNGPGQPMQTCFLDTGTITITEITATRVRGTFSGSGDCADPTPATTPFTVTNGVFDAPLLPVQ